MIVSIIESKEKFLREKKEKILEKISTEKQCTDIEKQMLKLIEIELKLVEKEKNKGGKTYVKRNNLRRYSKK